MNKEAMRARIAALEAELAKRPPVVFESIDDHDDRKADERDAARWRMLVELYPQWDRPRYGQCGTFDIFLPCKTPSRQIQDDSEPDGYRIEEHLIHPQELTEIVDDFIAGAKT